MIKKDIMARLIALTLVATSTSLVSNFQGVKASAATINNTVATNTTDNTSFTVNAQGQAIKVNVNKTSLNSVKVTADSSNGEHHVITYNRDAGYMIMDGKKINVKLTKEIDKSKINTISTLSDDDAVYECTNKITLSDAVTTAGAVAGVITAALSFGVVTIAGSVVKVAVDKALAAAGIVFIWSIYFNGYVKYDQYRTSDKYYTSGGGYQYMHRTENYRFGGSIGVNPIHETYINEDPSDWYFSSKPY